MTLPLPPSDPDDIRRIAFLGTPGIAVPALQSIHRAGYEIPMVVSGADKRRGRGNDVSPTPVKAAAHSLGLRVATDIDVLVHVHAESPIDLGVVVAFGQIIRPRVLVEIPMVNIHFSPLPRWRGAAPVERALLSGDSATAICLMTVAEGLDEGDIWAQVEVPISSDDTLLSLWESMSVRGADLLLETLASGFTDPRPQIGEPVYARKVHNEDLRLDWTLPATDLLRVIRVGNAWTMLAGDRFKIHDADLVESTLPPGEIDDLIVGTGDGGLRLVTVQPANKPRLEARAWANGARPDGMTFSG